MTKRGILLATSLVGAVVGLNGQAQAQQTQAASSGTTVGEVVVTAQRRAERLVDVPITVAVVSGAQLTQRGVTDVVGLQKMTAGLQMPYNGIYLAPSIRGISSAVTGAAIPTNVAIYVDGVYQPAQIGGDFDLPDVQDVEILKGPQGALYGENAEGGAIVITTLQPQFRYKGDISVSYGNYNDVQVRGYETGPITDTIAQSLAANFENHDGFYTNVLSGARQKGLQDELVHLKLLFEPNDKVAITFMANYDSHRDDEVDQASPFYLPGYGYEAIGRNYDRNGNLLASAGGASMLPSVYAGLNPSKYADPWPWRGASTAPLSLRTWSMVLKGVFDVGLGKLTWASSFTDLHSAGTGNFAYAPFYESLDSLVEPSRTIIEQGDFVSRPFKPIEGMGPIEFSTGLFYMHMNESFTNLYSAFNYIAFPGFNFPGALAFFAPHLATMTGPHPTPVYRQIFYGPATRDTFAGYLDLTYHVTPNLIVEGGGRYSTDTEHAYYDACMGANATDPADVAVYGPNNGLLPNPPGCPGGSGTPSHPGNIGGPTAPLPVSELTHSPASWINFSPRGVIRYKLTDASNVYFSFSDGYRSGGFNDGGLANSPFKPETVTAYEVGYKGTLFDQLSLGLAGFHYIYKNKLESINEGTVYTVRNAGAATNDGVDLDAVWRATPQLTFSANLEWLQATFSDYPNAVIYEPSMLVPGYLTQTQVNMTNHVEERSPRWSGTVGADYHVNTAYGRFNANASVYYSSKEYVNSDSFVYQKPYTLVDLSLGFTPASMPNLQFVLWGKNVTNTYYIQSEQAGVDGDGVGYAPPRQFGGRIEYKF